MDMDPTQVPTSTPPPPPPAAPLSGPDKSSTGMDANVAAGLAVLFGLVGGLIFFLVEKESKFVKFWAFQAILLSACAALLGWIPFLGWAVGLLILVFWVMSLINAFGGKIWKIPLLGNFAAQQAGLN